jgi:hypothetical protein
VFREILKNRTNISVSFFSLRGDKQREGRTLRISWSNFASFLSNVKCAAHLQKICEISGLLTDSGAKITLLPVRSTQLYMRPIGWHKHHAESQSFWITLQHFPVTLPITSLQLSSWHFHFITSYRTHSDLNSTVCIK